MGVQLNKFINKSFSITMANSPNIDAFGRLRISNPSTIFDSKQIFDSQPLFWDELLETGSGITSSHSVDEAGTTITSSLNTAGKFTRQTFMWFNYQPGKSQEILMTGTLNISGGGTGVQRRIGQFNDNNGLYFEDDEGTTKVVLRSKVTGSVIETKFSQSEWNLDKMDGTGSSKTIVDWSKSQIFIIDYEWLSVGRVRMGLIIGGEIIYVHSFNNSNSKSGAYMSTPNLPLRFQMITTGSSPASSMLCICSSVISEGGTQNNGILRYSSTSGIHIDANIINTLYAVIGLRLKSTHLGESIDIINKSMISETNDDFEWILIYNPTVAGTFTYSDVSNSAIQVAKGVTANTISGGTPLDGGFSKQDSTSKESTNNSIRLGSSIDGTPSEIVLCVRPLSANADIQASITHRELS